MPTYPRTHIPPDNYQISRMLSELGYPLMASHAETETNVEVLKGYAKIIEHKCRQEPADSMIGLLHHLGYLGEQNANPMP